LRQFLIIMLLIPGLALASSPGETEDCGTLFQGLMGKVASRASRTVYKQELERIEQIPVKDIFPDLVVRRGKNMVKVTEKNKGIYQDTFDQLWDNRYMSGLVPYTATG
jgi:hypothetical protein